MPGCAHMLLLFGRGGAAQRLIPVREAPEAPDVLAMLAREGEGGFGNIAQGGETFDADFLQRRILGMHQRHVVELPLIERQRLILARGDPVHTSCWALGSAAKACAVPRWIWREN